MPETIPADVAAPAGTSSGPPPRRHAAGSADRPGSGRSRLDLLVWLVPALVTAGLGGWRLTGPALWADELATWGAVRLSWAGLWQLSHAVDVVVTPYYAAMKIYAAVAGTSTAALRLPSVLAVIGTSLAVVALGRRLGGRWTGLTAGLLFAALPATSRYAQEARPYAFAMLAAALGCLCLLRLLDHPGIGRAAAYAGVLLFAGLSHPLSALLVLAGHAVAVAARQIRPDRPTGYGAVAWLGAALPGGLAALVLVGLGYRSRAQISWIRHLTLDTFAVIPERLFLAGAVGGIVLGLAVIAVRRDPDHITVAAAGFTPILVLLAADQFIPIWVARYVLVVLPPLAALAAAAALRSGSGSAGPETAGPEKAEPEKAGPAKAEPAKAGPAKAGLAQAAAVVALTAVLGYPAQLDVRESAGHGEDSAKMATVIGPLWKSGDVVVFPDTHPSIPWAARDMYYRYMPVPRPPDVLQTRPQRTAGHLLATECPDASCLGTPSRIWVVRVDSPADPLQNMSPGKQQRLRAGYRAVRRWSYPELGIILLEPAPKKK